MPVLPMAASLPASVTGSSDTIEECRSLIPKSAQRLRIGDPNPSISEVWMQQIKAQKAT
jgi:hypothetical protein